MAVTKAQQTASTSSTKVADEMQQRVFDEAVEILGRGQNLLVEAPTGFGKSGLMSRLSDHLAETNQGPSLILEDSLPIFMRMAGIGAQEGRSEVASWIGAQPGFVGDNELWLGDSGGEIRVVVGMVDTLRSMIAAGDGKKLPKFGAILVDEAHHASDKEDGEFRQVIGFFDEMAKKEGRPFSVVGASATPERPESAIAGSGADLLDRTLEKAERIVVPYMDVVEAGRVLMPQTIIPEIFNKAGKSAEGELRRLLGKPGHETSAFEEVSQELGKIRDEVWWRNSIEYVYQNAGSDSVVWFVDTMQIHPEQMARPFEKMGDGAKAWKMIGEVYGEHVRADDFMIITAETSKAEKKQIYEDFESGRKRHLISCQMLVEGFDVPRAKVAANFKKDVSERALKQLVGRTVRPFEGAKNGRLFDFGATSFRHGKLEDVYRDEKSAWLVAKASPEARVPHLLAKMRQHGDWWFHSNGRTQWYVKAEDSGFVVAERNLVSVAGQKQLQSSKLGAEAFFAKMAPTLNDQTFRLRMSAVQPSPEGKKAGLASAWEEHVLKGAKDVETIERLVNAAPVAAKASGSQAPKQTRGSLDISRGSDLDRDMLVKSGFAQMRTSLEELKKAVVTGASLDRDYRDLVGSWTGILSYLPPDVKAAAANGRIAQEKLAAQTTAFGQRDVEQLAKVMTTNLKSKAVEELAKKAGADMRLLTVRKLVEEIRKEVTPVVMTPTLSAKAPAVKMTARLDGPAGDAL